jgi:hypothetical protein
LTPAADSRIGIYLIHHGKQLSRGLTPGRTDECEGWGQRAGSCGAIVRQVAVEVAAAREPTDIVGQAGDSSAS